MKAVFLIVLVIFGSSLFAQKQVVKTLDAQGISTLQIQGEYCSKIQLIAARTNAISIQASISGEHNEDFIVVTHKQKDSLNIFPRFQPLFKADNDKLSAHKVISVELKIQLPKHLNIVIKGDNAAVFVSGEYSTALIELQQGYCELSSFLGSAVINTVSAGISVETNYAIIQAHTRDGDIQLHPITLGDNHIDLKSIHGDISVFKTE